MQLKGIHDKEPLRPAPALLFAKVVACPIDRTNLLTFPLSFRSRFRFSRPVLHSGRSYSGPRKSVRGEQSGATDERKSHI